MSYLTISELNTAVYRKRQRTRHWQYALWSLVLSVVFTLTYLRLNGNLLVPLGAIIALLAIGFAWQVPRSAFFIALAGSCIVETYQLNFKDSTTDLIPLFWDVNTAVQTYLKLPNFHAIPVSFFELIMIIASLSWLVRGTFYHTISLKPGLILTPILIYIFCVFCGVLNGLATGGQFNFSLFEVRAQFYLLFAYLMAVNYDGPAETQLSAMFWATALSIGLKGLISTYRFIVTFNGVTVPEIGIGAHEESFFFDCFVFQYLVLKVADVQPKLRRVMLFLLPFVVIANLANERRAATAAMVIAVAVLLALGAVAFPKRRIAIGVTAIAIAMAASIYLPLFWNGTGTFAQPARAIKSQFSPDPRDASSNAYRDAENSNLMYTMRVNPLFGYGYGKPIREVVTMVDLSTVDPLIHYITHNQILWVWMRLGFIGFYAFWLMVSSVLILGCRLLRHPLANDNTRAGALLCVMIFVALMVFGLLDMQISNVRDVLYSGLWAGTISVLQTACGPDPLIVRHTLKFRGPTKSQSSWNLPQPETVQI